MKQSAPLARPGPSSSDGSGPTFFALSQSQAVLSAEAEFSQKHDWALLHNRLASWDGLSWNLEKTSRVFET